MATRHQHNAAAAQLAAALWDLTAWAREHTSPRDANSPHAQIVAAVRALNAAQAAGILVVQPRDNVLN